MTCALRKHGVFTSAQRSALMECFAGPAPAAAPVRQRPRGRPGVLAAGQSSVAQHQLG
jgi:hypothetical protein